MKIVNIYEAETNLSNLINETIAGEEIIIAKDNYPVVRFIKIENKAKSQKFPRKSNSIAEKRIRMIDKL